VLKEALYDALEHLQLIACLSVLTTLRCTIFRMHKLLLARWQNLACFCCEISRGHMFFQQVARHLQMASAKLIAAHQVQLALRQQLWLAGH
jgi:hypothetical protein